MGSQQTPNEILLNYPKLKGGKGQYARPVIPERASSGRVRSGYKQRSSSFREKTPASRMTGGSVFSEEIDELNIQGRKNRTRDQEAKDGGDYAVLYRPSVVARMSGLSYVRSQSATHSRRILNSAAFLPDRSGSKSRMTSRTAPQATPVTRPTSAYSVFSTATSHTNVNIDAPSYKNDYYRCLAMKDLEEFRNTQFGMPLSPESLVNSLRQESRMRRLRRMTPEDFLAYKNSRNPIESMAKVFSLRIAMRVVLWKNRALATLAREREDKEAVQRRKQYIKELFVKTSKAIIIVCRWFRSLVEQSKQMTVNSAIELQWEATYMEEHKLKKYEFDAVNFSQKKAAKMPQWMRLILRKKPDDRTKSEINQLHNMLRGLSHYDRFTHKVQMELCKACTLIETEPMRVILRQGHKGQSFYFIYTGSVFINVTEYNPKSKQSYQKTRAILTRGEGFGEVALLRDTERMATVISREWCELLSVDKETFAKQCPQLFDDEIHNRLNFLQKHELFIEGWDALALYNLALSTNTMETSINQVVSKNEDPAMYFVMDGSCVVIKCLFIESRDINSASVAFPDNDSTLNDVIQSNQLDNQSDSDSADEVDFLKVQKEEADLNARKRTGRDTPSKKLDESSLAKPGLFDQFDLTYGKGTDKGLLEDIALIKKDTNLAAKKEAQEEKELEIMKSNTNSFSVYMDLTEKSARIHSKIAVFMEVGRLKEGDIFNLRENMKPVAGQNQTILVSETAKLLKMQISDFCHSLRNQDLFLLLTKKITHLKRKFPTDKEMIKLYKLNCNWEAYRQTVVNRVKQGQRVKQPDCRQSKEVMTFLGKPWKANPDKWLRELGTKQRNMDLKLNEPLKPPIY